jgi:single-strand DNA-binding protein
MNKVFTIGRFAADPELKTTGNGIAVTSFTIAVNRPYSKGEKQTDWLDVVAWRSTAEHICKHFKKGDGIIVEGTIQTRNWEDKNGQKRKAVEIVAENVEFLPRGKNENAGNDKFVPADEDDLPWEM